jgi:hypothetical protein
MGRNRKASRINETGISHENQRWAEKKGKKLITFVASLKTYFIISCGDTWRAYGLGYIY